MNVVAEGDLRKMKVEHSNPVNYFLSLNESTPVKLNDLLGKRLVLEFTGSIFCVQCGRPTKKSFQQGHCFPCMRRINECGNCILFPERCQVEHSGCPADDWAHSQCHAAHVVYIANSSNLKVGITRESNPSVRWIDQGATQAISVVSTANRYQSGLVEVAFKNILKDKSNWRQLLKQDAEQVDLLSEAKHAIEEAREYLDPIFAKYPGQVSWLPLEGVTEISYPVAKYPEKICSHSLDKCSSIEGVLEGIKGQYWILDTGVINIRKFSGYNIRLKVSE